MAYIYIYIYIERERERERERETDRQTDRQADRQTGRQRQTDKKARLSVTPGHCTVQEGLYIYIYIYTEVYAERCLVFTWLVPRETDAVSARSVYTIQPCTMNVTSSKG